jgi:hypothetical protein
MGSDPQHQRRCRFRLRSRVPDCPQARGGPFAGGASAKTAGYSNSNSTNHSLITHTLTSNNMQTMYTWRYHQPAQPPMIWQPRADHRIYEIANDLKGATPLSPALSSFDPECWYFVR